MFCLLMQKLNITFRRINGFRFTSRVNKAESIEDKKQKAQRQLLLQPGLIDLLVKERGREAINVRRGRYVTHPLRIDKIVASLQCCEHHFLSLYIVIYIYRHGGSDIYVMLRTQEGD